MHISVKPCCSWQLSLTEHQALQQTRVCLSSCGRASLPQQNNTKKDTVTPGKGLCFRETKAASQAATAAAPAHRKQYQRAQYRAMAAMVGIGSDILDLGRSRPARIASTGFEFGADPESFGLPNVANVSAHHSTAFDEPHACSSRTHRNDIFVLCLAQQVHCCNT
jgi:hypothetical protein